MFQNQPQLPTLLDLLLQNSHQPHSFPAQAPKKHPYETGSKVFEINLGNLLYITQRRKIEKNIYHTEILLMSYHQLGYNDSMKKISEN